MGEREKKGSGCVGERKRRQKLHFFSSLNAYLPCLPFFLSSFLPFALPLSPTCPTTTPLLLLLLLLLRFGSVPHKEGLFGCSAYVESNLGRVPFFSLLSPR